MLSYQHGYHAGNFADLLKHVTLTRLLTYLTQKEKPLFYLDTHAGRGLYDLNDQQALKTGEAQVGIELLWNQRAHLSPVFLPYLNTILKKNGTTSPLKPDQVLRYYPGSPALALELLRPQDRLWFNELHPTEYNALELLPRLGKHVTMSPEDGLTALHALLPPPERRGLIFIDPSYEIKSDYRTIPEAVHAAYKRFSTGVYCVWYPILDRKVHGQLTRRFEQIEASNPLCIEFYKSKTLGEDLQGTGLWILNAPYVLQAELIEVMNQLKKIIHPGRSFYLVNP